MSVNSIIINEKLSYQITKVFTSPINLGEVKLVSDGPGTSSYTGVITIPASVSVGGKKYIVTAVGCGQGANTGSPFRGNTSVTDVLFEQNDQSQFIAIESHTFDDTSSSSYTQMKIGADKIQQGAVYNNSKFHFKCPADHQLLSMVYAGTTFIDCQFFFQCSAPYNSQIIYQMQDMGSFKRCQFFYQTLSLPPQSEYLIQDVNVDGTQITLDNGFITDAATINLHPAYQYYLADDFSCIKSYTGPSMKLNGRLLDQCSLQALSNITPLNSSRVNIKFLYDEAGDDTNPQSINLTTYNLRQVGQYNINLEDTNLVQFKMNGVSLSDNMQININGLKSSILINDLTATVDDCWTIAAPNIYIDKMSIDYTTFQNLVGSIQKIQTLTQQILLTPIVLNKQIMFKSIINYDRDRILQTDGAVCATYYQSGWM